MYRTNGAYLINCTVWSKAINQWQSPNLMNFWLGVARMSLTQLSCLDFAQNLRKILDVSSLCKISLL